MYFKLIRQLDPMDCGPTCLKMMAHFYGKTISIQTIRRLSEFARDGVSLLGIGQAANKLGFKTTGVKLSFKDLFTNATLPCIIHWKQNHFVIVIKASKKFITIADPATGILKLSKTEFLSHWISTKNNDDIGVGIALLMSPTNDFYNLSNEKEKKIGMQRLYNYATQHKQFFIQIFLSLLIGTIIQLIFPFLTQSMVDIGINTHNLNFIYIVLIAQLVLYGSKTCIEFIRSRLLLYISTRVNLSILSEFWIKLMKLPLNYFDTKQVGDIIQRINDHKRIEQFLTYNSVSTIFSVFNLLVFSLILGMYNIKIFLIFFAGSFLYLLWILLFLKQRRKLDYNLFDANSKENNITMQLLYGMQDIKLNNSEQTKRWKWEEAQATIFKLQFKSLSLSQYQQTGAVFINESKNILISFIVATLVLKGQLTLGAMLAIQYIIGQLNSPIEQLIGFAQQFQDAKISLERLNEIHQLDDEQDDNKQYATQYDFKQAIYFKDLNFTYPGAGNEPVLMDINIQIPINKVTAIVGMNGSGKTTLIKLLQKFYQNYQGTILLDNTDLRNIEPYYWRTLCGSVLQDGYIFSDSIMKNIIINDESFSQEKLIKACTVANIQTYIEGLPLGFNTKIGAEGNGLSAGQKQRILIARAVYKNPQFVFFDEATNALDANNEKIIIENLESFFKNRTVIIVAHRLSTVKNADKIIVLQEGVVVEEGCHEELVNKKMYYYDLVKNQLELGQ
ncbi:MAG: peptidase domain-containing ABC transporter [Alphaproteobacteria bacterium]|nr:peptidase domain-containing ABC transporter [Alphaproteobacteria bacterium]